MMGAFRNTHEAHDVLFYLSLLFGEQRGQMIITRNTTDD